MKLQRVFGNIWIGPGDEIKQICLDMKRGDPFRGYHPHDVGILDVADDYPEYPHHRDVLFIHAGLNDGPEDWNLPYGDPNSAQAYVQAVKSLEFLANNKAAVFVHCHGGVSRSAFVVMLYVWRLLARHMMVDFDTCKWLVKQLYPRANPHPKHEMMVEQLGLLLLNY